MLFQLECDKKHRLSSMIGNRLLIIEDEKAIRDMVRFSLTDSGFTLVEASDVTRAKRALANTIPSLILLDWMLPGQSGVNFIHWLKKRQLYQNIPIIMLTARAEEENKVKGLEAGADDYVTKPFSPRELITRIKTVLRRGLLLQPGGILTVGGICLNTASHEVLVSGKSIHMTPREYKLLHFFLTHQNRVYSRGQLLEYVWSGESYLDERTVDVQIKRLRQRLSQFRVDGLIKTVRGAGYQCVVCNE
jgi:two-component system, OmpR family, phosphate regulon response regulator PhoB